MKILMVTNLFPPHYLGGYEIRCAQVAEHMRRAGDDVFVLTSTYGLPVRKGKAQPIHRESQAGFLVERSLRYHALHDAPERFFLLTSALRQLPDSHRFMEVLDEFQPDIVHWWNMEGLSKTLLMIAASRKLPCVYSVEDFWMVNEYGPMGEKEPRLWNCFWAGEWGPASTRALLRPILRCGLMGWEKKVQRQGIPTQGRFPLSGHACFVSEFVRSEHAQAGLNFSSSEVIYGGVATERFHKQRKIAEFHEGRLRFLYAGQLNPARGLHTIIEALGLLPAKTRASVELMVAQSNPGARPEYENLVAEKIRKLGLHKTVTLLGKISHEQMPGIYRNAHLLIFASTRPEGLPLTMTEAMCAGCAVITTGSGGAIELADRADLPVFPKDNPAALSRLLTSLEADRDLLYGIAMRGQEVAMRDFNQERMMDQFQKMYSAQFRPHRRESVVSAL